MMLAQTSIHAADASLFTGRRLTSSAFSLSAYKGGLLPQLSQPLRIEQGALGWRGNRLQQRKSANRNWMKLQ